MSKIRKSLKEIIIGKAAEHMVVKIDAPPAIAQIKKELIDSKVAFITTAGVHLKDEEPFNTKGDHTYRVIPGDVNYDESRFVLPRDLHSLSATEFTTLGHPLFPNYSVRIKESDFCDGTVRWVFSVKRSCGYYVWLKIISYHFLLQVVHRLHRCRSSAFVFLLLWK